MFARKVGRYLREVTASVEEDDGAVGPTRDLAVGHLGAGGPQLARVVEVGCSGLILNNVH